MCNRFAYVFMSYLFFFKQKTAYEMRISDWSSDVCSSDLPWESHVGGIMNTLVPEPDIPSHQGPDAQSVDPELDVVTMAVKVPQTLAHLHYWSVQLTRNASKDEVLNAFRASSRIALIRSSDALAAINTVKELRSEETM